MNPGHCVYMLTHLQSGRRYIGKGNAARPKNHFRLAWSRPRQCPKLYRAIRKYGEIGFEVEIIASDLEEATALRVERALIALYRTQAEFNICAGGQGPVDLKWSDASKERASTLHNSPEVVARHREASKRNWAQESFREAQRRARAGAQPLAAKAMREVWRRPAYAAARRAELEQKRQSPAFLEGRAKYLEAKAAEVRARIRGALEGREEIGKIVEFARGIGACPRTVFVVLREDGWRRSGTHKHTLWIRRAP